MRSPQVSGGLGAKIQFQLRVGEAFKWSTTRNGTASTTTIAHAKVNILYIFLLFKSPSNCLSNDRKETNTKEVKEGSLQFEVGHFYVTIRVKGFFYHMAIRPPNALASGYFWNAQVYSYRNMYTCYNSIEAVLRLLGFMWDHRTCRARCTARS